MFNNRYIIIYSFSKKHIVTVISSYKVIFLHVIFSMGINSNFWEYILRLLIHFMQQEPLRLHTVLFTENL